MSEFGGLRKHEQTQHARVGLGSAARAAAVRKLTRGEAGTSFQQGIKTNLKQRGLLAFKKTNQNTQVVKNKRQDKAMCEFSAFVAFNKVTNGQPYIYQTRNGEKTAAECHC